MKKIYTVTTMMIHSKTHEILRRRTIGWFENKADAEDVILKNSYDINEAGYYPYAVIEEVEQGIYPICMKTWWFKWFNGSVETYKACNRPKSVTNLVNFSAG